MVGKTTKKRQCSIDEIAIRIDQDNNNNNNSMIVEGVEKHRESPPPPENRFKIQEKIESLEAQCKELRGSLQQVLSEVHELKTDILTQSRDIATKINEKTHKSVSDLLNQLSQKIQIHDDRLKVLERPPPPIIQEHEPPPSKTTRVLRGRDKKGGTTAKTSCNFQESTSEEDESECSENFEESLLKWDPNHSQPAVQENAKDSNEEATDGIHNTLHELILCLRSQVYTKHEDLDVIVCELRNMTKLGYPSDEDVSTRQALILKVITCFYQTVCVVSMERGVPCEQIYLNEDLLQEALDKVQAII